MEFASEMVIRAGKAKLRITEIPITYFPREGRSKLRSFRDGWRHLRFMLLYSPTYLFLLPGVVFGLIGLMFLIAMLFGSVYVAGRPLGIQSMFLASLLTILGFQITNLGFYAKIYASTHDFDVPDQITMFLTSYLTLERALIPAFVIFLIGLVCNAYILYLSIITGFIALDLARLALFGLTMIVIGVQGIFSAFFYSIMGIGRNR
jgi:hypothetical protein